MASAINMTTTCTLFMTFADNDLVENVPQLVSTELRKLLDIVNISILISVVCTFGIVANIINGIIFYRQGLKTTFNMGLFSLAISDFLSVFTCQLSNIFLNPLFEDSGIPWDFREVHYLVTTLPRIFFGRITCWTTAYMTAERCLCIAMPLKVKQIVTPLRTAFFITFVYLINILSIVPEYMSIRYGWKFYPERNRTLLGMIFAENRKSMEGLSFLYTSILGAVSFPAVIIFTVILVVSLKRQAKWRQKSVKGTGTDKTHLNNTTKRDTKAVKMVVLIASILIVCYTPGVIFSVLVTVVPGFYVKGSQSNMCYVLWTYAFLFEAINSSVNIFMYYKMSTKYRVSFHQIFGGCGFRTSLSDKDEL